MLVPANPAFWVPATLAASTVSAPPADPMVPVAA
jgi:hypothetical protein